MSDQVPSRTKPVVRALIPALVAATSIIEQFMALTAHDAAPWRKASSR